MKKIFKQSKKVGGAGSFQNQIMSNNCSVPVIGQGATIMHYSDRSCYEVIECSEDCTNVRLQYLEAEWDKSLVGGHGHQNWIFKPTNRYITVIWKKGAWNIVENEIVFTTEFLNECKSKGIKFIGMWLRKNDPELADKIWGKDGAVYPQNIVPGITRMKKTYHKINILFGVKDYYYDWSF